MRFLSSYEDNIGVRSFLGKVIASIRETLSNFCSNFFFLPHRLLGALCCCICDPGVNVVTQEIKPAESLGQLLLFHLNSKSALQRISVALVICEWAALQKVRFCPKVMKTS